ncbi:sulfite exporter TauE/SafE family protein [Candidatus Undinarchaeota archaeon]
MIAISVVLIAVVLIFVAYTIKGFTGFGPALLSVPILTLFLDLKFVLPVVLLLDLVSSSIILWQERKNVDLKGTLPIFLFYAIGTGLGFYVLISVQTAVLEKLLGLFVVFFGAKLLLSKPSKFKIGKKVDDIAKRLAGLGSGILGSLFGTNGPPIVIYYSHKLDKKKLIRGATAPFFVIDCIWRGGMYSFAGLAGIDTLKFFLMLVPSLLLGLYLGTHLHTKIKEESFLKAIALILILAGIRLVI